MCHLGDDSARSTFRMSLGALLQEDLELTTRSVGRGGAFGFDAEGERRLTAWMCEHLTIAVRAARHPVIEEHRLIAATDPLLNINGRRRSDSAWTLLTLRRRCQSEAGA
jgi:hypothetical protein